MAKHKARNDSSDTRSLLQPDEEEKKQQQQQEKEGNLESTSRGRLVRDGGVEEEKNHVGSLESTSRGRPVGGEEEEGLSFALAGLKFIHQCRRNLGELKFSSTHAVLIDTVLFKRKLGNIPHEGKDVWLPHFVKMPCSKALSQHGSSQELRWKTIFKRLSALAQKQEVSVSELEEAIMKYNSKYQGRWSFDALRSLIKSDHNSQIYYRRLFPKIAALALRLPQEVKTAVPLLQSGSSLSITLSQTQISVLLANAFLCTFPHRNSSGPNTEYHNYPTINFSSLFADFSLRKREKLRAILHYFAVVTDEKTKPKGLVTFERRCLKNADMPNWKRCNEKMNRLYVMSHGQIEKEGAGLLQVDFASSWIGGGILGSGLVQEEILFLMNPELIVSRLFTEKLADNECLLITGSQQFSLYSGYSDSFQWVGPNDDTLNRDSWDRLNRQILALDALHFREIREQYNNKNIKRELNKAYCGFRGDPGLEEPDVATGKWGCGAFNGDPQLKALIQLMAAAKAGRGLAFFTFDDRRLTTELQQVYSLLVEDSITVGKLYNLLKDFCSNVDKGLYVDLFDFIKRKLRPKQSHL
ncbi:poly(ADP-ribose) glycohydrolase [Gouania willdenowi]|uniref:poly(ADP-ribose) glycohydrolase n=1 Tax=Gouania willdenowi TaxID=441366 RepID=A0A8C5ER94_GOUWI|nr:poly(ADP-ribose) glycohydrolase-like [Gouania willdenowi]XP_028318024.1 poly(ADP-ribose) glycohydrolase-like [Gouania willdenowi]